MKATVFRELVLDSILPFSEAASDALLLSQLSMQAQDCVKMSTLHRADERVLAF